MLLTLLVRVFTIIFLELSIPWAGDSLELLLQFERKSLMIYSSTTRIIRKPNLEIKFVANIVCDKRRKDRIGKPSQTPI
ncbi:hypothetical protein RRF57_004608 [Xylaria bambusicola]|uniref:Secreted protein n=1 Tax=Xylaria bambusicola TaxID=326684 RepID=A0AAN7UJH9_9PEZI